MLVHYVLATHERRPLVSDELQPKLSRPFGTCQDLIVVPGIPLTLHAGLPSAAPAALVGSPAQPDESCRQAAVNSITPFLK
jgi:hypothetical protein